MELLQIWGKSIAELIGGRFTLNIIERYDDLTHFIFLDRVNIFNSEKVMTFLDRVTPNIAKEHDRSIP